MRLNRNQRAEIAQETAPIVGQGHYPSPSGRRVDIGAAVAAAVAGTREFPPDREVTLPPGLRGRHATQIAVRNETTLEAARRLAAAHRTIALNFASAKNPGGGFLSGSEAQEESLARASSLYACLEGRSMYAFHRRRSDSLYTDYVIYSPAVIVFRDDGGTLAETPFTCSFL
ncbi:MAG: TIGR02452 family protein, partial [Alphaproteobacteria bacterium]|nr:TIGR02452 family protein [Alphaproteobacteria bacterium]